MSERALDIGPGIVAASPVGDAAAAPEALVDACAAAARTAYIACRRHFTGQSEYGDPRRGPLPWDGEQPDAWGRRRANVWPRLALHILRVGADPAVYVTSQFWGTRQTDRAISPTEMLSQAAVARYSRYAKDAKRELRYQLDREVASVRVMVKAMVAALGREELEAMRQALYDCGQVTASPLTRYCLAVEYNLPEVADHFRSRALVQYVFQRENYDAAWRECIPEQLRAAGAAAAARFAGAGATGGRA